MKSVVIYDDNCSVCFTFASGGKKDEVVPLGYSAKEAQELMRAQFGDDFGFMLMLFTEEGVYWGAEAARETMRRCYSPFLQGIMRKTYPYIVKLLNIILQRERLPEPPKIDGKNLEQSGFAPLTEQASRKFYQFILKNRG